MRSMPMVAGAPHYAVNARLNQAEYALGRAYLESWPRYMTIVLGNACNIDCVHCYQLKNGDNLLRHAEVGGALRREFQALYPYLETLRIQGGEVFALKGFSELLEDIDSCVDRPLVSISTNATLMSAQWCERLVDTPFQTITVSLDAGKAATFERIRAGARFEDVLGNVKRLQRLKRERNSWYPNVDAFFVVMRSNFREIPEFLKLLLGLGIFEVSFQTLLLDERNLSRAPGLERDERICQPDEIRALHSILQEAVQAYGGSFDRMAWSGLKSLFDPLGLDSSFLDEGGKSLYPTQDWIRKERGGPSPPAVPAIALPPLPEGYGALGSDGQQCPNPWTTLFVTENGDVSLCFLAEPVGNLYRQPLIEIWNSHKSVAKRSRILAGRYRDSGCSSLYCDWRDGKTCDPPDPAAWKALLRLFRELVDHLSARGGTKPDLPIAESLRAIRRLIGEKDARIRELEANLAYMWETNGVLHQTGQRHIDELEDRIRRLGVLRLDEVGEAGPAEQKNASQRHGGDGKGGGAPIVCAKPFEMLEVHEGGVAFLCCPSWCRSPIGKVTEGTALEAWNSAAAVAIRQSVLNGSFDYCDEGLCPYLSSRTGPVGELGELLARGFSIKVIDDISHRRLVLDHGPIAINCCYDRSCTLSCPSCRDSVIMHTGAQRTEIQSIQATLRQQAMRDVEHLFITGSGDPFASPSFREWLRSMSLAEAANLRNIHLHTNAQLLNAKMWNSLSAAAREVIHSMEISMDAASEGSYLENRKGGSWDTLLANLDFVSGLRAGGKLRTVGISMVVQNNNYKEMEQFIDMGLRFGFDRIVFSKILNWFPDDEAAAARYLEKAVHLPGHRNHGDFLRRVRGLSGKSEANVDWGNLGEFR